MSAFKAYDIRGVWGVDLDADLVYRIGRCVPSLLGASKVLVGRDVRVSSPEAHEALLRGLTEAGADVDDLGLSTTPMTYFFTGEDGYEAACMITASHNRKQYNGLKFSRKGALPVGVDSGLKELEAMVAQPLPPKAEKAGVVRPFPNAIERYAAFLSKWACDLSALKVVVDCSNGMGALMARRLFAGAQVTYLNEELDGTFPNHEPNPLLPEATEQLRAAVKREGADFGVMFDGDADRVAFVDERGEFVRPDLMTAILAEYYLAKEPGSNVLCDIRTSRGVTEAVSRLGGVPHLWKVGHAFAKVKLRELKAPCGGELAGHYYFRDFHFCDSAMLCALIVLNRIARAKAEGQTVSQILAPVDCYANSGECNYVVEEKDAAIDALEAYVNAQPTAPERVLRFDGNRYDWPDAWFNVRKSNTEPYLRLLFEATTPERLAALRADVERVLKPFVTA